MARGSLHFRGFDRFSLMKMRARGQAFSTGIDPAAREAIEKPVREGDMFSGSDEPEYERTEESRESARYIPAPEQIDLTRRKSVFGTGPDTEIAVVTDLSGRFRSGGFFHFLAGDNSPEAEPAPETGGNKQPVVTNHPETGFCSAMVQRQ